LGSSSESSSVDEETTVTPAQQLTQPPPLLKPKDVNPETHAGVMMEAWQSLMKSQQEAKKKTKGAGGGGGNNTATQTMLFNDIWSFVPFGRHVSLHRTGSIPGIVALLRIEDFVASAGRD